MVVQKEKNNNGCYDISLIAEDGKTLRISFGGNLDLYWYLYDSKNNYEIPRMNLVVTKENFYIWNLFDQLYNGVANYWDDVHANSLYREYFGDDEYFEKYTELLRKQEESNPQRLMKDGVIEWHHDDHPYDEANVMRLYKDGDNYVVEMDANCKNYVMDGNSVRFSNSGSRYQPFNRMFMRMFNELQDYDELSHQIHMEEVFYEQDNPKTLKLTTKKQ